MAHEPKYWETLIDSWYLSTISSSNNLIYVQNISLYISSIITYMIFFFRVCLFMLNFSPFFPYLFFCFFIIIICHLFFFLSITFFYFFSLVLLKIQYNTVGLRSCFIGLSIYGSNGKGNETSCRPYHQNIWPIDQSCTAAL